MTWDEKTWDGFCALLEEGWPGDFDDDARESWRVLLDDLEPPAAVLALKRLLLKGGRFRPSVSELLAETRADPSRPTFDEAYPTIYSAAARGAIPPGVHPLIESFVQRQGVDRLGQLPLDDPTWGEKTRRDLRGAWIEHVETWNGREIAALAAGGSPRRLDAAASLQIEEGA